MIVFSLPSSLLQKRRGSSLLVSSRLQSSRTEGNLISMWRLIFLAATSSSAPTQFNNPWDKSPNDGQANRGQDANSSGNNKSNNDGDKHVSSSQNQNEKR